MKNLYFFLVSVVFLLAACESEEVAPQAAVAPTHTGIVQSVNCGLYIKLSQGTNIFDDTLPFNFELREGQQVELSYRTVPAIQSTSTHNDGTGCYEDYENNDTNNNSPTSPINVLDPLTQCMNAKGIQKVQISEIKEKNITT